MGFSSYFLIVWDFIKYARDHDIPVGPGRGSAVGSLVAYCLRITDLDPIKFKLIFERFLNPERISMPDIDTDFCVERRDEVIHYVTEKYGNDRVAQIVTFGTMAARAAVRDAGRALARAAARRRPGREADPVGTGRALDRGRARADPRAEACSTTAIRRSASCSTPPTRSKGLARHASTHAAGVVISKNPLTDHVPLVKLGDGDVNTQYDMNVVERVGLLKIDFLGLRNLTVMKAASDEIRRTTDAGLRSGDDPRRRRAHLRDARPRRDAGRLPARVRRHEARLRRAQALGPRRHHRAGRALPARADGLDPAVHRQQARPHERPRTCTPSSSRSSARPTASRVYQEQVMQIARDLAGFTMGQADELRKVMGKKQKDKIPYLPREIHRGLRAPTGSTRKLAEEIFAFIEPFAGYGFNKSHAAAYGWIAYQTAYLKANYPLQYFAALMSSVRDKTDKLVEYIEEAQEARASPCCRRTSTSRWSTSPSSVVRFASAWPRSRASARARSTRSSRRASATAASPISSIWSSASRRAAVNRKVYEALIKCGALDALPGNRAQLLDALDGALDVRRARIARPRARAGLALRRRRGSRAGARAGAAAPLRRAVDDGRAGVGEGDARHLRLGSPAGRRAPSARAAPARRRSKSCAASRTMRRSRDRRARHRGAPHADQGAARRCSSRRSRT